MASNTISSVSFDSVKSFSANALDTTDKVLTKSLRFLSNNYINNIVLVLLLLYAPVAAPMISPAIVGILGNYAVKFIYVFLLAYLLSKSVKVSLLTSLVIVIGMFIIKKLSSGNEHFENSQKQEKLPQEPVVDRVQTIKSSETVVGVNSEPHQLDNVATVPTSVSSVSSDLGTVESKEESQTGACGLSVPTDGVSGYDESHDTYSAF
jgi:predicted PurR-regulated permease PerM